MFRCGFCTTLIFFLSVIQVIPTPPHLRVRVTVRWSSGHLLGAVGVQPQVGGREWEKKKKTLIRITQERFVTRVIYWGTSRSCCWLFWKLERTRKWTREFSGRRVSGKGAMWSVLKRDTINRGGGGLSGSQQLPASSHLITGEMKGPRRNASLLPRPVTKTQQKRDTPGASSRCHFLPTFLLFFWNYFFFSPVETQNKITWACSCFRKCRRTCLWCFIHAL